MVNLKFKVQSSKFFVLATCSLLFATCLSGCGRKQKEKTEKMPVKAVEIKRDTLNEYLFYVGDIKARDEVMVYPKVTGKIMQKLLIEGETVNKGDTIAYIDRDEVGFQFAESPVESPIDGLVGRIYVDRGTQVSPQTPISLIVDIDVVKVKVNVVEKDLPKIAIGQIAKIKIDAYPDAFFQGKIEKVSPVVDSASRTALIEITIPNNEHRLKPGMFARINILINKKEGVLIIPRDAIIRKDSSHYAFIVKDNNKVHQQKIKLGINENNKFEVVSGLKEGEFVVTMGNLRLKEGDTVEIVERDQ